MQKRNATVAVIGAGDYIGGEIAKKFASEGFTVFAGRRNGAKLEPLGQRDRESRRRNSRALARCTQGRGDHFLSWRRGQTRSAGGLHLQHRRQRQLSDSGYDRTRVPQGLGNGLLFRLSRRPRSGAADAAPWQRAISSSPARPRAFAAGRDMLPSPARSSACGPLHRRRRASWVRRTFTWRISSSIPASTPNGCVSGGSRRSVPMRWMIPMLLMPPSSVAESYWLLYQQPRSAWTFELEICPFGEKW